MEDNAIKHCNGGDPLETQNKSFFYIMSTVLQKGVSTYT